MTKKKQRPLEKKKLSKVEEAREMLLDPFAPVLFPGLYHFAIGAGSLIFCAGISSYPIIDIIVPNPENHEAHFYTFLGISGPLIFLWLTTLFLVIKGRKWAHSTLRFYSISPLIPSIAFLFSNVEASPYIGAIELAAVFSLIGFFLLRSKSCRALINILVIRRYRKQQMKRDGTYATNLACSKLKYLGVPKKIDGETLEAALSLENARQESRKTG